MIIAILVLTILNTIGLGILLYKHFTDERTGDLIVEPLSPAPDSPTVNQDLGGLV